MTRGHLVCRPPNHRISTFKQHVQEAAFSLFGLNLNTIVREETAFMDDALKTRIIANV